jgi:hypothetical protein
MALAMISGIGFAGAPKNIEEPSGTFRSFILLFPRSFGRTVDSTQLSWGLNYNVMILPLSRMKSNDGFQTL